MLRIFYAADPTFRDNTIVSFDDNTKTHKFIGSYPGNDFEKAFTFFQGEVWSPNGEARDLIHGLGLHHTSMSVGDIVVEDNGKMWMCQGSGWQYVGKYLGKYQEEEVL